MANIDWKMDFLFNRKKKQKDKLFKNVTRHVDPSATWKIAGDLGEGSFGMVHKVALLMGVSALTQPGRACGDQTACCCENYPCDIG